MKTTMALDHQPAENGTYRVRVLLRLEGDAPESEGRPPLNLALVLDHSGSMAGAKLANARAAAIHLVQRLRPEDVVSVVAYDQGVRTVAHPGSGHAQSDLPARIEAIGPGGMTNLAGGWVRGRDLVHQGVNEGVLSRVLLLTDGLANVGITRPDQLMAMVAKGRQDGITTTTLGFGADFDEVLLAGMADAGGGHTWYIEHADQAPAVFAEEIAGLLDVAAQNLSVTIRPAAASRLAVVHHAYPRVDVDGGVRLEVGDLYARHPRTVLAEFFISGVAPHARDIAIAELEVEADVIRDDGLHRERIRLPIGFSPAEGAHVDPEVQREALLLEAAQTRREAIERRDRDGIRSAETFLRDRAAYFASAMPGDADFVEEAQDLALMAEDIADVSLGASNRKYLYWRAHNAERSRRRSSDVISRSKRRRDQEPPADD